MLKQQFKGFLAGVIITCMLFTVAFAAPVTKTIKAVFDSLNMQINGKAVKVETIVYNNTLYAPVKVISESLGKEFQWDSKTNAVTIKEKQAAQPAPTTKSDATTTTTPPTKPAATTTTQPTKPAATTTTQPAKPATTTTPATDATTSATQKN